ncbi:MAG: sugar phosphate isomerase/epimerase [Pseudomonadota bacterium]|nr:sugar phosphate isomerase/epimerase [Pseudomonadota bacterium]
MWPGLVGKGPDSEPPIDLDTMIELTVAAEVDGEKFDGIDLFLADPHTSIDADDGAIRALADKALARNLAIGSLVAPVWPPVGGGAAMGGSEDRKRFLAMVRKACRIGARLRELGVRNYGVVRIDSASSVHDWAEDPQANTKRIAKTFREACVIAEDHGERLAAEGEICWGGMHSWRHMLNLFEETDRPETLGFQADMAHTLLYTLGHNAPEHRILPDNFDWQDRSVLEAALKTMTDELRPLTFDFHVAQNDATVKGMGSHDKTGRHCLPNDPAGKLDIPRDSGYWMRDGNDKLTKAFQHICWDGCMFSNAVMTQRQTWNDILAAMVAVRATHGWQH